MRLKEFAHGFDLSGSVDRSFRKGSFGNDEEQNYRPCAPLLASIAPAQPRQGRVLLSDEQFDAIADASHELP
jgi:hypothetical protein